MPPQVSGTSGPSVPLEAAISAFYTFMQSYVRTEIDPQTGISYTGNVVLSNLSDTSIENISPVKSVDISRTVSKNGTLSSTSNETSYFQISPYKLIATRFFGNPLYVVAFNQLPLPITAKPGDSGKFYDSKTYDSTSKGIVLATASQTWAVTADTDTTVKFCVNSVVSTPPLPGTTTRSDCLKIDVNGKVISVGINVFQ